MSDETTPTNQMTVSISEYNELKAQASRVQALETALGEEKTKYSNLNAEFEVIKSKKKIDGPSKEELEAQVREEYAQKYSEVEAKAKQFEGLYRSAVITDTVIAKLQDKVIPSALKYLKQDIEKECDLEGDLASRNIIIKDAEGKTKWSAKTANQKMSVDEYIEELAQRAPEFFKSNARGGEVDNTQKGVNTQTNVRKLSWADMEGMSQADISKIAMEDPKALDQLFKGQ